jgi:hypothetical protein
VPFGGTATVSVTTTEQTTINNGISGQVKNLTTTKNSKVAAVNALTTVAAVVAYDVTAGWPSVPLPPGYGAQAPIIYGGSDVTLGTAPPTGGIPEAPTDGLMYGRQSAAWQRALAITNDLLDGGNF